MNYKQLYEEALVKYTIFEKEVCKLQFERYYKDLYEQLLMDYNNLKDKIEPNYKNLYEELLIKYGKLYLCNFNYDEYYKFLYIRLMDSDDENYSDSDDENASNNTYNNEIIIPIINIPMVPNMNKEKRENKRHKSPI